ncbi:MAG: hypothetical protein WBL80_08905 [Erysipelotrichaceae bacterium]
MSEPVTAMKPKRKSHRILWTILLIPVAAVALVFTMLTIPKAVNVKFNDADLQTYIAKGGIVLNDKSASFEDIFVGKFQSIGAKKVDVTITSAEVTAILNKTLKAGSVVKNIRIRFTGDNTVEASATITNDFSQIFALVPDAKKYEGYMNTFKGKSLYAKSVLTQGTSALFESKFVALSIGSLPLPVDQANSYGTMLGTAVNQALAKVPNFKVESFKIDATGLHFKGTIPQEVRSLAGN